MSSIPGTQHSTAISTSISGNPVEDFQGSQQEATSTSIEISPLQVRQRFQRNQQPVVEQDSSVQSTISTMHVSQNNLHNALLESLKKLEELSKWQENASWFKLQMLSLKRIEEIKQKIQKAKILLDETRQLNTTDQLNVSEREQALSLEDIRPIPLKELKVFAQAVQVSITDIQVYLEKNSLPEYTKLRWIARSLAALGGVAAGIMIIGGFITRHSLYASVTTTALTWLINECLITLLEMHAKYQIEDIKTLKENVFSLTLTDNIATRIKILKDSASNQRDDDIRNDIASILAQVSEIYTMLSSNNNSVGNTVVDNAP